MLKPQFSLEVLFLFSKPLIFHELSLQQPPSYLHYISCRLAAALVAVFQLHSATLCNLVVWQHNRVVQNIIVGLCSS